jgi:hypothetical protein
LSAALKNEWPLRIAAEPPVRAVQQWATSECRRAAFAEIALAGALIGVPVLPVKGVLTSHLLYAQPTDREMVDIDVRVRRRDLARLCAAGEERGWVRVERSRAYACAAFKVFGERVELEAHVGPPGFCRLTVDAMIERATEHVEPFGVPHLQPELHDHALLLIVNAFKDQLVNASSGGLVDLARISALPDFSFEQLASRAREGGVAVVAWLVGEWMIEKRGEPRWGSLLDALGEHPRRRLYAAAFHALVEEGRPPSLALRLLVRAAPDRAAMQASALATTVAWWLETLVSSPALAVGRIAKH